MILVTGGTGYIGSHAVVELLKNNQEVIVLDSFINSKPSVLDRIKQISEKPFVFVEVDLCNLQEVNKVFSTYKIDKIIHFAAFKSVGESVLDPLKYYKNNLLSLLNLLECCKEYEVKDIIFSSSCTVYGEPAQIEIDENQQVAPPASPYGNTKKISEEILRDSVTAFGFKAINLRYFNPIGSHESGLLGDEPDGIPNNLIPYLTKVADGELPYLQVFGGDYPTPDGTCIRDYVHVVDLALAHVKALDYFAEMPYGAVDNFNLGTGHGNSVLEVIRDFEQATGVSLNYQITARRAGDITAIFANARKAKDKLKWEAKYSLQDMLSSAWKFQKNSVK